MEEMSFEIIFIIFYFQNIIIKTFNSKIIQLRHGRIKTIIIIFKKSNSGVYPGQIFLKEKKKR
jgi:hypothetical protein